MSQIRVLVSDASYDQIEPFLIEMIASLDLTSWYEGLSEKSIFIKPNMLGIFPPDQHATTHPSIVSAVVKFFRKTGAKVIVGDNCGVGGYGLNQKVAKTTGILEASDNAFKNVASDTTMVPLNSRFINSIVVSKDMLEADVLINLPKMKTHSLTVVTGAIKNMFGIVSGAGKSKCHKSAPKVKEFNELLADIYALRQPDLTIMDGIVAMEGNGPSSGKPKSLGKMLASTNAVALDAVMCRIMGVPPEEIYHIQLASQRGLGPIDSGSIHVVGELPSKVRFKLPVTIKRFSFLGRLVNSTFFARIIQSKLMLEKALCKKCKICAEGCPTEAMQMEDFPSINEDKCIKCFCCHELCPESAWKVRGLLKRFQGRAI